MKKILKIIIVISLIVAKVNAQEQVYPLGTVDYPNGAYLKDLDNQFQTLEGIWQGESDNKLYTLEFVIFEHYLSGQLDRYYNYRDYLAVKLKVKNLTSGKIIYNNLNAVNYEDYKMFNIYISDQMNYEFFYSDTVSNCINEAFFNIKVNNLNPNIITYKGFRYGDYYSFTECEFDEQTDIPIYLPKGEFVLVKQ